jgi:hypothetical protein
MNFNGIPPLIGPCHIETIHGLLPSGHATEHSTLYRRPNSVGVIDTVGLVWTWIMRASSKSCHSSAEKPNDLKNRHFSLPYLWFSFKIYSVIFSLGTLYTRR